MIASLTGPNTEGIRTASVPGGACRLGSFGLCKVPQWSRCTRGLSRSEPLSRIMFRPPYDLRGQMQGIPEEGRGARFDGLQEDEPPWPPPDTGIPCVLCGVLSEPVSSNPSHPTCSRREPRSEERRVGKDLRSQDLQWHSRGHGM